MGSGMHNRSYSRNAINYRPVRALAEMFFKANEFASIPSCGFKISSSKQELLILHVLNLCCEANEVTRPFAENNKKKEKAAILSKSHYKDELRPLHSCKLIKKMGPNGEKKADNGK